MWKKSKTYNIWLISYLTILIVPLVFQTLLYDYTGKTITQEILELNSVVFIFSNR